MTFVRYRSVLIRPTGTVPVVLCFTADVFYSLQRRSHEFDLGGYKWVKERKQPHKKFKVD